MKKLSVIIEGQFHPIKLVRITRGDRGEKMLSVNKQYYNRFQTQRCLKYSERSFNYMIYQQYEKVT